VKIYANEFRFSLFSCVSLTWRVINPSGSQKRTGPGRRSNAEHAIAFCQFILENATTGKKDDDDDDDDDGDHEGKEEEEEEEEDDDDSDYVDDDYDHEGGREEEEAEEKEEEAEEADDDDEKISPQYIIHGMQGYEYHLRNWKAASTIANVIGRLRNHSSSSNQHKTLGEPSASASPVPSPRKRGRPSKSNSERKRGRPPKTAHVGSLKTTALTEEEEEKEKKEKEKEREEAAAENGVPQFDNNAYDSARMSRKYTHTIETLERRLEESQKEIDASRERLDASRNELESCMSELEAHRKAVDFFSRGWDEEKMALLKQIQDLQQQLSSKK
jgi:hypothetical protein